MSRLPFPANGPSRRTVLAGMGCAAWTGLLSRWSWGDIAPAARKATAKNVILIFNCGAPSHIDIWDPKPSAPEGIRGPFRPIQTSVSGLEVSELIPDLAKRMHQLALLRTVSHGHSQHNAGMYWSIVGRPYPIDSTLINPGNTEYPCFGTLVNWLAQRDGLTAGGLPPYVITPKPSSDGPYITPGQYGACLGKKCDPFVLNADPNLADFEIHDLQTPDGITPGRVQSRRQLLQSLDRSTHSGISEAYRDVDVQRGKALSMMQSDQARQAFDLSQEKPELRDRYGRNSWGQSHLLARRLVQSGVKFVTTVNGPGITWDTHKDNFNRLQNRLVPQMQQAFVALLDDLTERNMLDSTLVVWMGDFGRSPTINKDAGRDHWPDCYSMVLA
ncbi:MAG TPA: DUF1501 domain-containing protein, partial [Humisphaera sp.]|nr:DUF1501 domain-containing protein [Humisphaera sp.]